MASKLESLLRQQAKLAQANHKLAVAREPVARVLVDWGWKDAFIERTLLVIEECRTVDDVLAFVQDHVMHEGMPNEATETEINILTHAALMLHQAATLANTLSNP